MPMIMPLPENLPEHLISPREHQIIHNDRYLQDKKLGSGNFGTAYLVFDSRCPSGEENQKVLKRIHVGDIEPGETNDAKKEATLLSRLHHENVVQFHESFFDGKYFCIVTEYCDGGDMDIKLQEYKKKNEFVAESQVTEWLHQLLRALRYLHRQHILHRDLKAKNIFLKANRVKLGDFGISKILMGTADMASTFVGTPYYMSPEVIKHDKYNDKSDIWSLGCILYEICTLKHAFDGQSLMAVMYKIVTGDIPHLPEMYSRDLNDILGKMLAREQDDRSTAAELLQQALFHPKHDRPNTTGLTPKERLRIKKQRLADENFRKLQELAEKTRLDNEKRHRESVTRNFHHTSIDNFSSKETKRPATSFHPGEASRKATKTQKSDLTRSFSEKYGHPIYYSKNPSGSATLTPNDVVLDEKDGAFSALTEDGFMDPDSTLYLARSMSKDGLIPDEPGLAERLYALDDDFEDSDMEYFELDEEDDLNDSEYKQMMDQMMDNMQQALHIDESTVVPKDDEEKPMPNSAMTNRLLSSRIKNMRKACVGAMGEEKYNKGYSYLQGAWSNKSIPSAAEYTLILQKLRDIVKDDQGCFLLEQLVYLENEVAL